MATCRTCAYLRKCIEKATREGCEHDVDFDASSGCPNFGFKSNTNADRIRAMTDEELADFLSTHGCPCPDRNCHEPCNDCALEWLQQPAEGE